MSFATKTCRTRIKLNRKVFGYPYILFLTIFVVLPLVLILVNAFIADGKLTLHNFVAFVQSSNMKVLLNSLIVGVVTTVCCLLIGYPVAFLLNKYYRNSVMVLMFILPMWVNFLIRTLATRQIFEWMGVKLGMGTVLVGMIYNYLPFMILPLYNSISGIDKSYIEAAQDLGADNLTVLLKAYIPLSLSGIISGITMVFIPTISTFAISELLSDRQIYLFGDSINDMFMKSSSYGVGSVMSLVMLALVLISNFLMNKFGDKEEESKGVW
ncbi:MAG: ABC transporter permease [Clostridia bacterium]|nr:ABC transporter permease [Clostridia bacterium]